MANVLVECCRPVSVIGKHVLSLTAHPPGPLNALRLPSQARPGHVYRQFFWGNRASLWEQPRQAGVDVRARLLEYYRCGWGLVECSGRMPAAHGLVLGWLVWRL